MSEPPILNKIHTMGMKELEILRKNTQRVAATSLDPKRVADAKKVLAACERELLKYQPKAGFHRRTEEVMAELGAKHGLMKLANNRVRDGVSPGGAMRAGWHIAEYYIGFKCPPFRRSAVFAAVIINRESDIEFWVYDLDHPVVRDGNPPEWLQPEWDLGIPMLRTKNPDEAAKAFKQIIRPHADLGNSTSA